MGKTMLDVSHVGMKFNLSKEKIDNIKEYIIKLLKRQLHYNEFWALKDITFKVEQGDRVGILGLNGAGKSTLLKIISGVFKPTEGKITVNGKIVPLLELGAGFEKQYTGGENIYLYGTVLGYTREFLKEKYDEIVEFSGLGEFIDVPIKNYSSGMRARLGFSIATIVDPEILILDEVLSVGDRRFKKKSLNKIKSMMASDVTVLFVSHNTNQIRDICNKAILLQNGKLIANGEVNEVCDYYEKLIDEEYDLAELPKTARKRIKRNKRKEQRLQEQQEIQKKLEKLEQFEKEQAEHQTENKSENKSENQAENQADSNTED